MLLLLESLGRQLDEQRPQLLGLAGRDGDGSADQWNAFLSFSKKPALVLVGVVVGVLLELLEQPPLLLRQAARHGDADQDPLVAAAEALQYGHPLALEHADVARLRPRLELELDRAVERLDGHSRAEGCLDDRQVDLGEDVVALAHEPFVVGHPDLHVGVARPAAE